MLRAIRVAPEDVVDVFVYVVVLNLAIEYLPAVLLLWLAAVGSKMVVLWLVDLVFGDAVSLLLSRGAVADTDAAPAPG